MSETIKYVVQFWSTTQGGWMDASGVMSTKGGAIEWLEHEQMLYPQIYRRLVKRTTTETVLEVHNGGGANG